jgi:prophage DNA circulation protein
MGSIADFPNPWRNILLSERASFAGVIFHVEQGGRSSGRRTVTHEYPKRDLPYAEDMGRSAIRFSISGYLIYRPGNPQYEYTSQRIRLYNALEKPDADTLVHPVFAPGGMQVQCERYTMTESRERGGYTVFEMAFVEAGAPVASGGFVNTAAQVLNMATGLEGVLTSATSPLGIASSLMRTF